MKGSLLSVAIISVVAIFLITTTIFAEPKPKYSCSDTDGGNVINVFGTVSGYYNRIRYSYSDYCVDLGTIMEYYCVDNYAQSQQQSCGTDGYISGGYCLNNSIFRDYKDYYCTNGACSYSIYPIYQYNCNDMDGYSENYCYNGDIYRDYRDFYCFDGMIGCNVIITQELVQDCPNGCNNQTVTCF
ncbi:MAG: hypothetical protein QXD48_00715 [Candidatus Aenigmatarchaeota archaeon]